MAAWPGIQIGTRLLLLAGAILGATVPIGPPIAVSVKPIDGGIEVNISAPDAFLESKQGGDDLYYVIVLWQKDSVNESIYRSHVPLTTISCLVPGTTYCLKVRAELSGGLKHGIFSPVNCFKNVKGSDGEPCPQNIRVEALNLNYVLKWDWNYKMDSNVTFSVEMLWLYDICDPNAWSIMEGCKNITVSECVLSDLYIYGRYVFRVSAFSGKNNKSLSSTVQFSPIDDTQIGPPKNVTAAITKNMLVVTASDPDIGMLSGFKWAYHLVIWPNSSESKVDHYNGTVPYFTIKNWDASSTYCFKVRLYEGTRLGLYSKVQCITTPPGSLLRLWIFIPIIIGIAVIALLVYLCICPLQRYIKHIFFPSGKLPSSIEKGMFDSPVNHRFLLQQEEPTDMCHIINTRNKELAQKDFYPQSSSIRDSGNYSNEEESTGDQTLIIQ